MLSGCMQLPCTCWNMHATHAWPPSCIPLRHTPLLPHTTHYIHIAAETLLPLHTVHSHEFEAAKAKQNEESQQRQMAVPGGQRWGVRRHYKQALEQRLQEEEEQQQQVGRAAGR